MVSMVRGGVQGEAQQREVIEGLQSRRSQHGAPLRDVEGADDGRQALRSGSDMDGDPRRSAVFFYVLLDGFDLGVGMLCGFAPRGVEHLMMNSVAPVWDGNETWLILGGVGLLAVFPLAFAIIIPAVYFPSWPCCWGWCSAGWRSSSASSTRACAVLGWRVLRRFGGRLVLARCGAGRAHPGLQSRGPKLRRRLVRLADTVLGADGRRADVRLRPAGRGMVDHEDRGRLAGLGTANGPGLFRWGGGGDRSLSASGPR